MPIPTHVQKILQTLHEAGFEAFAVGGCVRDTILERTPKDWDITTNAKPEEIQKLFPKSFYTNEFGTVGVIAGKNTIEVTTYRTDANYSDNRHPDEVEFVATLKEDLARRDFTINSMAMVAVPSLDKGRGEGRGLGQDGVVVGDLHITDPFGGLKDLNAKLIRAVGNAEERFGEDALRLMRAIRFATELKFEIEPATYKAIQAHAADIKNVSQERIRDELIKIVMSDNPELGFNLLHDAKLLPHVLPELESGVGVGQNRHHIFSVFEHNIKSCQFAAQYGYSFPVRLASLLHDIGKPKTKRFSKKIDDHTFYGHEVVGAHQAAAALKRLRFSAKTVKHVTELIYHHMFYYDVGKVTEAGARRLLKRVGGKEMFSDLVKVRIAERKGSGVPKAEPYRLRHLQFLVDKASQDPINVNQLAVNGGDLIKELKLKPGPQIGGILNALLAEVLEDPQKNNREHLLKRGEELKGEDPDNLKKLGADAITAEEQKREEKIKKDYHV